MGRQQQAQLPDLALQRRPVDAQLLGRAAAVPADPFEHLQDEQPLDLFEPLGRRIINRRRHHL